MKDNQNQFYVRVRVVMSCNCNSDIRCECTIGQSKLKKWRWFSLIILIILISVMSKDIKKTEVDHIARISLEGMILHDSDLIKKLKHIEEDPKAKAVILHIDSPGGTTFAGEELYVSLKRLNQKKPVVAVLDTMAASGGYMVALASDYIIARNMTTTGSIGVLFQSFEAVELANKLGLKFESFKSSPLKASPNPMEVTTPEVTAATMETIQDSYEIFVDMLIESRKLSKEQALKLADGKVYIGKRAKELNLIDEIGGEEEALKWLESKQIDILLPIEDAEWMKPQGVFDELKQFFRNGNNVFKQMLHSNNAVMATMK